MVDGARSLLNQHGCWQMCNKQHGTKDRKIRVFRAALRGEEGGEKGKRQRAGVGGNIFVAGEVTQHFGTQCKILGNYDVAYHWLNFIVAANHRSHQSLRKPQTAGKTERRYLV